MSETYEERLLWLDVETTGIYPDFDLLLSVAAFVTDSRGERIDGDHFEAVIGWNQHTGYSNNPRDLATDYVQAMHDSTGLWGIVAASKLSNSDVDDEFYEWLVKRVPNQRQARIAGNSVRLDANFMEAFLPNTFKHLHYRLFDVSALAYFAYEQGWMEKYYEKVHTHRALDDIQESIEEFVWVRDSIEDTFARRFLDR